LRETPFYSAEAVKIALKHPSLLLQTHDALEWVWPRVQARLAAGHAQVTEQEINQIDGLLKAYAVRGSKEFRLAVEEVCNNLKNEQLLATLGITLQRSTWHQASTTRSRVRSVDR
jgi:hypothetical protein